MLAFCIESSHVRGMGHLFRSLTLADALKHRGHEIKFLVNDHAPTLSRLYQRGYLPEVVNLGDHTDDWETPLIRQMGIQVWIDDRLDTDISHALRVKSTGLPLVTFDDRGTGASLADLNVAALVFEDVPLAGKCVLQGPEFLILNPEIARYQRLRTQSQPVMVTLGGTDTWGVTVRIITILARVGLGATVFLGPGFSHRDALAAVITDAFELKENVPSLIEEMSKYELAITGGGITPFEANASGLPCIVVANEHFEVPVGRALERLGGSIFAGHYKSMNETVFERTLAIAEMSRAGLSNIGLTGVERVMDAVEVLLQYA